MSHRWSSTSTVSVHKHASPIRIESSIPIKIGGQEVEIVGRSIAGQETCIMIPRLRIAFDIGRCPQKAVPISHVFLSHSHMDHMGGIALHSAARTFLRLNGATYYVPEANGRTVEQLFDVYQTLNGSEMRRKVIYAKSGDSFTPQRGLRVEAFKTYHSVPSLGYCIFSRKEKLKPKYSSYSSNDLTFLRENNVKISNVIETPEVVFTGDTSINFIQRGPPYVRKARTLIMELTFLDDRVAATDAARYGHMHIENLKNNLHLFQNELIILTHVSPRYKVETVIDLLTSNLPATFLNKCVLLMNQQDIEGIEAFPGIN